MQMFRILLIACIFAVWAIPLWAISPMSPAEAWAKFRLKKDLTLVNGVDIYETFAAHYHADGVLEFGGAEPNPYDLSLAWQTNSVANKQAFTLKLLTGTTILKALKEIADRRGERVTAQGNHVLIAPAARAPMQLDNQRRYDHETELDRLLFSVIACSIVIHEPVDDDLERFLNAKLQQTWDFGKTATPCPYRIQTSVAARKRMTNIHLLGTWAYVELLDVVAYLGDVRWKAEGTVIQIDADGSLSSESSLGR